MIWHKAIAATVGMLACLASSQEAGFDAMRKKDFSTAYGILKPFADSGKGDAQFALGLMYDEGNASFRQDPAKAMHWYKQASASSHPLSATAAMFLGGMYVAGQGEKRNVEEGIRWLKLAYEKGQKADAAFELAKVYVGPEIGKPDSAQAAIWMEKSALEGNTRAMGMLAVMLMETDRVSAFAWAEIAAGIDPVQGMTATRGVIKHYMTQEELGKSGKRIREIKKRLAEK